MGLWGPSFRMFRLHHSHSLSLSRSFLSEMHRNQHCKCSKQQDPKTPDVPAGWEARSLISNASEAPVPLCRRAPVLETQSPKPHCFACFGIPSPFLVSYSLAVSQPTFISYISRQQMEGRSRTQEVQSFGPINPRKPCVKALSVAETSPAADGTTVRRMNTET